MPNICSDNTTLFKMTLCQGRTRCSRSVLCISHTTASSTGAHLPHSHGTTGFCSRSLEGAVSKFNIESVIARLAKSPHHTAACHLALCYPSWFNFLPAEPSSLLYNCSSLKGRWMDSFSNWLTNTSWLFLRNLFRLLRYELKFSCGLEKKNKLKRHLN